MASSSLPFDLVLAQTQPIRLLPDITLRESDLRDHEIIQFGDRKRLRFSTGALNQGDGRLSLEGIDVEGEANTQLVRQRIEWSDGKIEFLDAGIFAFHETHLHIHFEDWVGYRLREVLPENDDNDGVGDVVASSEKVSFCILDGVLFRPDLPNADFTPHFPSCGKSIQGLSVGWVDVYNRQLPGQNIDITDLPDGFYWLEAEVDPEGNILESNEDNNVTRIQITIGNPPRTPDSFEPNDSAARLLELPPGGPNSPNLGPCNPKRVVSRLNLHRAGDRDWFRFYVVGEGSELNVVRLDFDSRVSNLDLRLFDEAGAQVASSGGIGPSETIHLTGVSEGWYSAEVFERANTVSPDYRLTIVPPTNAPPTVSVISPSLGEEKRVHGVENFVVRWAVSDPEQNETWVTVYLNHARELDGSEELAPTSLLTDGSIGLINLNSAEFSPGTYWVYCEVTDGGSTSGAWSAGTVNFASFDDSCRLQVSGESDCNANTIIDSCEIESGFTGDCNGNGVPDGCDIRSGSETDTNGNGSPDPCDPTPFHRGDSNQDGAVDLTDVFDILNALFRTGEIPLCKEAANANNDDEVDISDPLSILNFLFAGTFQLPAPGAALLPCGPDPDTPGSRLDLGCETYTGCSTE